MGEPNELRAKQIEAYHTRANDAARHEQIVHELGRVSSETPNYSTKVKNAYWRNYHEQKRKAEQARADAQRNRIERDHGVSL